MHKEHILAFAASELAIIRKEDQVTEAFNSFGYTPADDHLNDVIFNKMQYATEVIWRDSAERWEEKYDSLKERPPYAKHRQILPYALLSKIVEGVKLYAVYQRVKGIGESRLLKGHSIGWGGHLTGCYVQYDSHGGIQVKESIYAGLAAEMMEEAQVDIADGRNTVHHHGYIHSVLSPVDALHLGVVMEVQCGDDVDPVVDEEGLVFKGFKSAEELKAMHEELKGSGVDFENWSRFIIEEML